MATIKSYTDIKQSKKLAKILPLESADMYYFDDNGGEPNFKVRNGITYYYDSDDFLCCWSLAALLGVLPDELEDNHFLTLEKEGKEYCCCYEDVDGNSFRHCFSDSPVDACVAMVESLHQFNYAWECKGSCTMKRGEQKPADKVEPKLHEGDWVVYKNDICQIVKREEGCNKLVTNFGIVKELVNERNLSTARLWTIQDAKAGDVLATKDAVFIFKHIDKTGLSLCKSYCEVIGNSELGLGFDFSINGVHPATKEQRDTLFAKIKEARYKWDVEHKQLKTIVKDENDMDYIGFDKLAELAKPLQLYVTDTIHSNVTIIITPASIKVCEDIAFTNT